MPLRRAHIAEGGGEITLVVFATGNVKNQRRENQTSIEYLPTHDFQKREGVFNYALIFLVGIK